VVFLPAEKEIKARNLSVQPICAKVWYTTMRFVIFILLSNSAGGYLPRGINLAIVLRFGTRGALPPL
jgi:hypothetical protein